MSNKLEKTPNAHEKGVMEDLYGERIDLVN
jgi:hypothetical protein